MNKVIRTKSFMLLFSLVGISFASCSSDDNSNMPVNEPVTLEEINGAYTGKAKIGQGNVVNEVNAAFLVKENVLSFEEFPIKEIVGSVIEDKSKVDETVAKIGKVEYKIDFKATLNNTKTAVIFDFTPKALELNVPEGEAVKKVVANVVAPVQGAFVKQGISVLSFQVDVDKVTVDGTEKGEFVKIKYVFHPFAKKSK
ncbi:hypothetical protein AV926_04275 [Myroides marinus]|uniref:DUF4840 domain-containing protein n=1 Tax=Myroides marinus TaxID=703342 RepID=A0A164ADG4_9FLAO|nr:DUF4840 domain-containing protein [Myroides marinus]KZE83604.1 hypothetical protein AV926_04275 [Myroides marinus]